MELQGDDRSLVRTLDKALYIIGKRKVDIKEYKKLGRKLLKRKPVVQEDWAEWAADVDQWLKDASESLVSNFGAPAVAKFEDDAGVVNGSHQGVSPEFQKRMDVVNHRLHNLDAIAQQPDAYVAVL